MTLLVIQVSKYFVEKYLRHRREREREREKKTKNFKYGYRLEFF
jgi:hypothetical protein